MKVLSKYWKLLLTLILVFAAAFIHFRLEAPAKAAYETEKNRLNIQVMAMQKALSDARKYEPVMELLEPSLEEIAASREELYAKFPVELKEEDQILYMLYLEEKFGNEVIFQFAEEQTILQLRDGSELQGATVTFDYSTTYDGFKNMVQELATDSRITSVRQATMDYDTEADLLSGQITVTLYLLKDARDYEAPDVDAPEIGKDNPFTKN